MPVETAVFLHGENGLQRGDISEEKVIVIAGLIPVLLTGHRNGAAQHLLSGGIGMDDGTGG